MKPDRRLLLVEIVIHERWIFESRLFPFIQGFARQHGARTRWLCFGARMRTEKTAAAAIQHHADLDADDLATLERHVRDLEPTHVIISQPLPAPALAVLRCAGEVQILSTSDHAPQPGVVSVDDLARQAPGEGAEPGRKKQWLEGRTGWLPGWLGHAPRGVDGDDHFFVGTVSPDYAAVMANDLASTHRPHLLLLGGVTCDHFHSVAKNPHFAGLDLSACAHDFGCSYCTWYRGPNSDLKIDPVELAEQQLRRVVETAGEGGRFQGVVDLLDIRLLKHLDRFAKMARSLDLPPTTFCLEPRIDRVLQLYDPLLRALETFEEAGHRLYLFRMGAENLVDAENERFNKHLVLDQLDQGRRRIERLEERFPGTFEADPTWGYITCSPWTTFEELRLGIALAVERQFEPLGVWLYTPLLLYRDAPISRLAERDGLVAEGWDDMAVLYEPSVNGVPFETLIPHRFADPRTAAAFGLITRFCAAALRDKYADTIFNEDDLYQHLLAHEPTYGLSRPDLFALEVTAALALAASPPDDPRPLLLEALAAYDAVMARLASAEAAPAEADEPSPEEEEDDLARRYQRVLGGLIRRLAEKLGAARVVSVRRPGPARLALTVRLDDSSYELLLTDAGVGGPGFFATAHFVVSYRQETPLDDRDHIRRVQLLVKALDKVITRHAPELLLDGE